MVDGKNEGALETQAFYDGTQGIDREFGCEGIEAEFARRQTLVRRQYVKPIKGLEIEREDFTMTGMQASGSRNIVLCVASTKPRAVARALRLFSQNHRRRIAEVRFLVLEEGAPSVDQKRRLLALCREYNIDPHRIHFDRDEDDPDRGSRLWLDSSRYKVQVNGRTLRLTPREFFFYALYARFRAEQRNGDGAVSLRELKPEDFDVTLRRITRALGGEVSIAECHRAKGFQFLRVMVDQMSSAGPRRETDWDDFKEKVVVTFARINRKLRAAGLPPIYAVSRCGPRGQSRYWLGIPPEAISFLDGGNEPGKVADDRQDSS